VEDVVDFLREARVCGRGGRYCRALLWAGLVDSGEVAEVLHFGWLVGRSFKGLVEIGDRRLSEMIVDWIECFECCLCDDVSFLLKIKLFLYLSGILLHNICPVTGFRISTPSDQAAFREPCV
jgi:hypothetical protein